MTYEVSWPHNPDSPQLAKLASEAGPPSRSLARALVSARGSGVADAANRPVAAAEQVSVEEDGAAVHS